MWTPCQLARGVSTFCDPSRKWTSFSQSPAVSLMSPGRWTGLDGHMTAVVLYSTMRYGGGARIHPPQSDSKIPPSSTMAEVVLTRAIKWGSKLSHGFARVALTQRGKTEYLHFLFYHNPNKHKQYLSICPSECITNVLPTRDSARCLSS